MNEQSRETRRWEHSYSGTSISRGQTRNNESREGGEGGKKGSIAGNIEPVARPSFKLLISVSVNHRSPIQPDNERSRKGAHSSLVRDRWKLDSISRARLDNGYESLRVRQFRIKTANRFVVDTLAVEKRNKITSFACNYALSHSVTAFGSNAEFRDLTRPLASKRILNDFRCFSVCNNLHIQDSKINFSGTLFTLLFLGTWNKSKFKNYY